VGFGLKTRPLAEPNQCTLISISPLGTYNYSNWMCTPCKLPRTGRELTTS
jgi:hypothetical protein